MVFWRLLNKVKSCLLNLSSHFKSREWYQHSKTGRWSLNRMSGLTVLDDSELNVPKGLALTYQAMADFDGNGTQDL